MSDQDDSLKTYLVVVMSVFGLELVGHIIKFVRSPSIIRPIIAILPTRK
jgi:hypothetical protein